MLERPKDEVFVRKWQLACEEDIAHVVVRQLTHSVSVSARDALQDSYLDLLDTFILQVMPNVTREKIDKFVGQLVASTGATFISLVRFAVPINSRASLLLLRREIRPVATCPA